MGHKKVCIRCRLTLTREFDDGSRELTYPCPKCRKEMILLPHRFRPPKKRDEKKWKAVEYLLANGFRYEHTGDVIPENLRDAQAFWIKLQIKRNHIKNLGE